MRRLLSCAITATLAGGFLVVDVVSLPGAGATEPRIQSFALASTLEPVPAGTDADAVGTTAEDGTDVGVEAPAEAPVATTEPTSEPTIGANPEATTEAPVPSGPAEASEDVAATAEDDSAAPTAVAEDVAPAAGDVLTTGTIETQDFTVAGITWDGGEQAPTAIEVRLREDDGWSEWVSLEPNDEGPDAGTEEFARASQVVGTDPVVTDGADAVEVRVTAEGGDAPAGLEVSVIDPGTSAGDATLQESTPLSGADAAVARPAIISRAAWGADESLRNCSASYSSGIKAAAVHHTAGSNSYTSGAAAGVVRGIYAYHTNSLGWCDIGYNFLVDKWGRIYEGRAGGMDKPVRGAHAGGFNDKTVGISMIGNYDLVGVPAAMQDAVARVAAWKLGNADIDPQGSTTLVSAGGSSARWPSGTTRTLPTVFAHRDVGYTACPGRYGMAIMPGVRATAAAMTVVQSYVTAVYVDMLKRMPDSTGMTTWSAKIVDNGGDATPMMRQFTSSTEYRNREINDAYQVAFGRDTDSKGLEHWRTKVARGEVQLEDIAVDLLVSAEFYNRSGGTTQGFVKNMYRTVMGREVDSAGLRTWSSVVESKGRRAAVLGIWDSYEATGIRVDALYQEFLKRGVDPTGRKTWTHQAQDRGDYYVRDRLVLSGEYRNKAVARF
jgi:uncharacterized protein with LGFP repeats